MKTLKELKEGLGSLEESIMDDMLIRDMKLSYWIGDDNVQFYLSGTSTKSFPAIPIPTEKLMDKQTYKDCESEISEIEKKTNTELELIVEAFNAIVDAQILQHIKELNDTTQKYYG